MNHTKGILEVAIAGWTGDDQQEHGGKAASWGGAKKPIHFFLRALLCLSCIIGTFQADAACNLPWVKDAQIPTCPQTGSSILSDEYPALAYFVDSHLPDDLKKTIEKVSRDRPPALIESQKFEAGEWAQDFFEAFFDKRTGKPVLRLTRDGEYLSSSAGARLSGLVKSLEDCGVAIGPTLQMPRLDNNEKKFLGAYAGGNIEGLPGGLCMHGDSQKAEYADQYCSRENQVIPKTKWLRVGHADEMIDVVPTPKKPCGYLVQYASPAKGLELLKDRRSDAFMKPPEYSGRSPDGLIVLCRAWAEKNVTNEPESSEPEKHGVNNRQSSDLFRIFFSQIVTPAYADVELDAPADPVEAATQKCLKIGITNGQALDVINTNLELKQANELIEKNASADATMAAKRIREGLRKQGRTCDVHVVPLPDLFAARVVKKDNGQVELEDRSGDSLLPNPTNSLIANGTVLYPKPFNSVFEDYLSKLYGQNNINSQPINSWTLHSNQGNVHCGTHAIRFCKP